MRISDRTRTSLFCAVLAAAIGVGGPAQALDPNSGVSRESGPFDLFKFGFSAYKKGRKDEAVEAYKYAAEKGHPGARWALANMYAYGDGVIENDYEAFKIYDDIARQGVEPGSQDTGYFVNALLSLANYYQAGIPGSPVKPNLGAARQLYFQAASAFGVPEAQYRLGRMILEGKGGANDIQQAKKWLNRARVSGHPAAAAVLGNVVFEEGQVVRGLAFMTTALERSTPNDRVWIQALQERAFSLAGEADRRTAVALAQDMLAKGLN
ncbi:TPR repeat, SEL1 subfamily [Hoeflea phototrophica DFL-43]|jgi:TPR repeat protein|uniref:TPR repeat, SEL1 subfamily n=1 Tax=Hoeflea phototrophica (strain DSM 17068 / NCIMB 14078 / DFL-43) TaxID=411684 RepID=A9D5Q7_HOEPD|nr:tetratricopeptide repeat protein [Hoeflea phototrophica]EDQ33344.1 TPR repeat, SEL1 subfamily [Hoeflea phototrophica DFL-43]